MLYVHEMIDLVAEGAQRAYMEHAMSIDSEGTTGGSIRLAGTWQVVNLTGRWPRVLNLWELVDGWDGWQRVIETAFVNRADNQELARWLADAAKTRSGGRCRLVRAHGGVELRPAQLFVHDVSIVRAGAAADYLAAVRGEWEPVARDFGHHMLGGFEVLMSDSRVVTIWATSAADHVRLQSSDDPRISTWRRRARLFTRRRDEELLVPCPGSPLAL